MFVPLKFLSKWKKKGENMSSSSDPLRSLESRVPMTDDQIRATWLVASWLITYPDDEVFARLDRIEAVISTLPAEVSAGLGRTVAALRDSDIDEIRSEFVETFDTRRKGCLYLTYFANGDTRRRGMALLEIKQLYREAGLEVSEDELPDHLAYVLEFGAAHDLRVAARVLLTHRAGVELLRLHLDDISSPWHPVIAAVCATLPPLDGDDMSAVAKLASEGPASEEVGLSDGAEDMPPMDMSPYAIDSGGVDPYAASDPYASADTSPHACGTAGAGSPAFVPLSDLKGPRS